MIQAACKLTFFWFIFPPSVITAAKGRMKPFSPLMLHLLALVSVVSWFIDLTALNVSLLMAGLYCCCVSIAKFFPLWRCCPSIQAPLELAGHCWTWHIVEVWKTDVENSGTGPERGALKQADKVTSRTEMCMPSCVSLLPFLSSHTAEFL